MSLTINGQATNKMTLKQREGKLLTFTYNVAISTALFALIVKDSDGTIVIQKNDADFDKTDVGQQKVYVNLAVNDLDLDVGSYNLEVRATWNATTSVDKTETIKLKIIESLFT